MSPIAAALESDIEAKSRRSHWEVRRWLIVGLTTLVGAVATCVILLATNWPFTENAVVGVLQERFARAVTIDHFDRSYFPPGCVAEGIKFLHRKHKDKPPLITVQKLVIQGSYSGMLGFHKRLPFVRVVGLHVTVPPTSSDAEPNPVMPLTHPGPDSTSSLIINTAIADGAVLDFLPVRPGTKIFHFAINKLRLDDIENDKPISYRVRFPNSVPPGIVESSGAFGPWNPDNPGSTPVHGSYVYRDANLVAFQGISGTLSSNGEFSGTLARLNATGRAEVPNFQVMDTSHTRRLTTEFTAVVNATNGDTELQNVVARFNRTTVTVRGGITSRNGQSGKTGSIDLLSTNGRIEDVLDLFISARQAPMTGRVGFRAHLELPPAPEPFVKRLELTGDFGIGAAQFTDRGMQQSLSRLSESAEKGKEEENPETVLSNLKGHAVISDGIVKLSNTAFDVPGATATVHGTYSLVNYAIDLHGTLKTKGQPGDATSGFKSLFLKALTPFFKKQGKAKLVPIKITGRYGNTNIGLDMTRR